MMKHQEDLAQEHRTFIRSPSGGLRGSRSVLRSCSHELDYVPFYKLLIQGLVQGFGLSAHVFADDLQVYCHFLDGKEQIALQLFRDFSELWVVGCLPTVLNLIP